VTSSLFLLHSGAFTTEPYYPTCTCKIDVWLLPRDPLGKAPQGAKEAPSSQLTGWEDHVQNDPCVEWDVKPYYIMPYNVVHQQLCAAKNYYDSGRPQKLGAYSPKDTTDQD